MSRVAPQTLKLARCLVACETSGDSVATNKVPAAFLVFEKLHPHLVTYMGSVGVRALLARSLLLAGAEVPWVRTVLIKPDGSPEGLDKLATRVDPAELTEGSEVLVAQLLHLLNAFIGEELMLRLVREVWVTLPPDDQFGFTKTASS